MIADSLFVLAVSILASLPILFMVWKSYVEGARNRLYDVRGEFVVLVAKGSLKQDSAIFEHYYPLTNNILRSTEKMHLEGLLKSLGDSKISEAEMKLRHQRMRQVSAALQDAPEDVQDAVKDFYDALREILLLNSNFFSAAYVISKNHKAIGKNLKIMGFARKIQPEVATALRDIEKEYRYLKFCHATR